MAQTDRQIDKQTDRQTDRYGNSMTQSAQCGRFSEEIEEKRAYRQHSALSCDSGVPILYHESKSIPWVLSISRVLVYTMSPCQYHDFMSIPWVLVNSKRYLKVQEVPSGLIGTLWSNRYLKVQKVPKGPRGAQRSKRYLKVQEVPKGPRGNTMFRSAEIHITGMQKYKLKKYQNINYRNTEIQIIEIQKNLLLR